MCVVTEKELERSKVMGQAEPPMPTRLTWLPRAVSSIVKALTRNQYQHRISLSIQFGTPTSNIEKA